MKKPLDSKSISCCSVFFSLSDLISGKTMFNLELSQGKIGTLFSLFFTPPNVMAILIIVHNSPLAVPDLSLKVKNVSSFMFHWSCLNDFSISLLSLMSKMGLDLLYCIYININSWALFLGVHAFDSEYLFLDHATVKHSSLESTLTSFHKSTFRFSHHWIHFSFINFCHTIALIWDVFLIPSLFWFKKNLHLTEQANIIHSN